MKEKIERRMFDAERRDTIRGYNEYNRRDDLLHRSESDPERRHRLETILRALSHTQKS
jgi:hypothetical protein